jgi:twinkle protein
MSAAAKSAGTASGLSQTASDLLRARGLDLELCDRLGVTSGRDRAGREEIVFAYERGGRVVNRKYRGVDQKEFRQDKGGEQIFWRADCIGDSGLADQPLIITEGEIDAIAAIQAGHWRTVSVPGGAPAQPLHGEARASGKYAFIEADRAALEQITEIILAVDNDPPGVALLSDLTALLGPARCKFVSYPRGCKDLGDVLRLHGVERVRECIEGAKWVRFAGVHQFFDMPPLPPPEIWRPNVHQPIDDLIPIIPGQVSVWTGIPGHGKSALVNAIVWSIAERDGLHVAHGTFEAAPQREYLHDAIGYFTRSPARVATEEEQWRVKTWLHEHIIFLVSDGYAGPGQEELFDADLDWFFEAARTAVVRHGCRIVILDPWSQIEHARPHSEPETTYIQRSIRRARTFARSFDVHVGIVAHPTKQQKRQDGTYAMPEGYEISGSANWYNSVDLGVTIHRAPPLIQDESGEWIPDPKSTRVLIRVWKKKNHSLMGKPGDAYASFDCATGRYSSAEHWEERTPPRTYGHQNARHMSSDDD